MRPKLPCWAIPLCEFTMGETPRVSTLVPSMILHVLKIGWPNCRLQWINTFCWISFEAQSWRPGVHGTWASSKFKAAAFAFDEKRGAKHAVVERRKGCGDGIGQQWRAGPVSQDFSSLSGCHWATSSERHRGRWFELILDRNVVFVTGLK